MRLILQLLVSALVILVPVLELQGQEDELNYGKTPDELVPYGQFQKAYKNFFDDVQDFTGAGREKPEPTGLSEIKIGLLGPLDGSVMVPQGIQMLQGATLAMEEANKLGGYKGIPFKILAYNDAGLWGAAANEVVKMNDENIAKWTAMK
jgi:branched-chain amino acid transport system substrate-binding protein